MKDIKFIKIYVTQYHIYKKCSRKIGVSCLKRENLKNKIVRLEPKRGVFFLAYVALGSSHKMR